MTANDLSLRVATALRPVLMRFELVVRRQNAQYALSRTQISMLTTLCEHGVLRMSELAQLENVRVSTTSNSVSVIAAMGLVERLPDPADKRGVCVQITELGRRQVAAELDSRNADLAARIDQLEPEQQHALERALPAIDALLGQYDLGDDEA